MFVRMFVRELIMFTRRMPPNVPTVKSVTPLDEPDLNESLQRLRDATAALNRAIDPLPLHPFFGRMSKERWQKFYAIHARHHLRAVERTGPIAGDAPRDQPQASADA
jgi:hypothetical protein